jgi:O-antigen ligase
MFSALDAPIHKPFQGPVTRFWLVVWAVALSLGWLLPNHYLPWPSFHLEAWTSTLLLLMVGGVFLRIPGKTALYSPALFVFGVTLIPLAQYAAGMHPLAGAVWVAAMYLFAFMLAMVAAARWESAQPAQLADGLFLAIGIAAIVSVGLQLHQWLSLDRLFLWDMGNQTLRPFANFGQPTLLSTFLLWGLLGVAWGMQRQYLGKWIGLMASFYLLFGVALTGSRTPWIAVAILVAGAWYWRDVWRNRWTPWLATGLAAYFWMCLFAKGWILRQLLLGEVEDVMRAESGGTRLRVWAMLFDAALLRPWFGYGWNQIAVAHLEVAAGHPPLYMLFANAHNVFLDLVLWSGFPLGLMISAGLVWWMWRTFRTVRRAEDVLLLMLLLVLANHAMLEYPFSYAYLLLPAGLVVGMLDARLTSPVLQTGGRWIGLCLSGLMAVLLSLVIRDYSRVEASYLALRFEFANLATAAPREPPEVVLLTHLRELIRYARYEPHPGMSDEELAWMVSVVNLYPSAGNIHKLAAAMAWNKRPDEARLWLQRMCGLVARDQCEAVRQGWARKAAGDPIIRGVPWPANIKD